MPADTVESRLRRFLLLMTALIFLATFIELVLEDHTKEPLQLLPFVICTVGLLVAVLALLRPRQSTLTVLRVVMAFAALGGLAGIAVHLLGNVGFAREIRPNAAAGDVLLAGLKGAAPLLAPGALAFAALLAVAATYRHPALENPSVRKT